MDSDMHAISFTIHFHFRITIQRLKLQLKKFSMLDLIIQIPRSLNYMIPISCLKIFGRLTKKMIELSSIHMDFQKIFRNLKLLQNCLKCIKISQNKKRSTDHFSIDGSFIVRIIFLLQCESRAPSIVYHRLHSARDSLDQLRFESLEMR